AGSTAKRWLGPGSTPAAKLGVRYTVKKFVRHGHRLFAYGTATSRYIPASGATTTSRQAFTASVAIRGRRLAAAQTICPVLELTIQQLDLNLLGALVHLDKVGRSSISTRSTCSSRQTRRVDCWGTSSASSTSR